MKCEKSGNHTISYQSLLLSTTVLNDVFSEQGEAMVDLSLKMVMDLIIRTKLSNARFREYSRIFLVNKNLKQGVSWVQPHNRYV